MIELERTKELAKKYKMNLREVNDKAGAHHLKVMKLVVFLLMVKYHISIMATLFQKTT